MSFLQQIGSFDKQNLSKATTIVTDKFGNRTREDGVTLDETATMIISDQSDLGDDNESDTMEFESFTDDTPSSELAERVKWMRTRMSIGNGFVCGNKDGPKIAIFVEKKEKNERHFDTFAFLLHKKCTVVQVDHDDLVQKKILLQDFKAIIFPGGPVCHVHESLQKDGAKQVAKFVFNGGGFVGVCAGAFIASAKGYGGCKPGWQLLNVETSWHPGVGSASTNFQNDTNWLEKSFSDKNELYFANGPMFCIPDKQNGYNKLIKKKTNTPNFIAKYTSINTDKNKCSDDHMANFPGAIIEGNFGDGKVICFGPHPEASSNWPPQLVNAILSTCQ